VEQALVFASIVLGVAVAFELGHLNGVLRSDRVRWHWAQPAFALFVLLTIISYWWMAAAKGDGPITLGEFLPIMFQLVLLVLLAAVSLPDRIPEEGVDLAEYYQRNRRYQWLLMALYMWSLHISYLIYSAENAASLGQFLRVTALDTVAGLVMIAMIFARRWSFVALGFLVLSVGPVLWIGRSIG
jgi:hypothetical protein